jgi:Bacterial SH3 domain
VENRFIRRPLTMAGMLGVAGLLAACANQPSTAYNAPSAMRYPPPQYSGSTGPEARAPLPGSFRTTADLHLRAGPGDGAPIVATLRRGTPVRRNGMVEGNWWGVASPDGQGWVYDRYLAPI